MCTKGTLILIARYQTPAAVRRAGHKRIAVYLRNRGVKGAEGLAEKRVIATSKAQSVTLC